MKGFAARIAELDPSYEGTGGDVYCFFCGSFLLGDLPHHDDCLWLEAKSASASSDEISERLFALGMAVKDEARLSRAVSADVLFAFSRALRSCAGPSPLERRVSGLKALLADGGPAEKTYDGLRLALLGALGDSP